MNSQYVRSCGRRQLLVSVMFYLFLLVMLVQPTTGYSGPLYDANKLLANDAVLDPSKPLELRDGGIVRVDYLRTLLEAYRRLGEVSKVNALLAIEVEKSPGARANNVRGMIVVTTGMLDIVGADPDMTAALVAHEFAHFSLRHFFQDVLNLPNVERSRTSAAGKALQQTGDRHQAALVGVLTESFLLASYSRQQETEADKVGTEFLSSAKYNPSGMLRLLTALLKITGPRKTSYFDTHPGFEERLANAEPTVVNQRFAVVAATLVENKDWERLTDLVNHWLKTSPDSARAWYYYGVSLRELHRQGALQTFARAVRYDQSFTEGRLAFCIELYRAGQHRDSLVCSEYLPLNEMRDEFAAKTFQHPIHVAGMNPALVISDADALIISRILERPDLAPRSARQRELDNQEQNRIARQSAVEQQGIDNLRRQCERYKELPIGPRRDELMKQACTRYDDAVRRQAYGALNRQQAR